MWLNKVYYVGEGWWSLLVRVCRAWLSPWRSVSSWGPTAFCLRASSARTSSWCGCSRTMTWGRMIWTGEADIHTLTETNFLISRRFQLSWGEFPKAPQRNFLPLCTRRGLTSGSLQNTRGRLAIIPLRATSISEHGVFHWTSLPLSVLPPIYPSPRCSPSWLFLQCPQRPNENSRFVCFIRLWGLIVFTWCNESSLC